MHLVRMRCERCETEGAPRAKFCANCGEPMPQPPAVETGDRAERVKADPALSIGFGLGCFALTALTIGFAIHWIGSIGEPSAAEVKADEARYEQQAREETVRQQAFNRQQQPLWSTSADHLTRGNAATEIGKCKQDIERGGSPYAWMYDNIDPGDAVAAVRAGRRVLLTVEHRLDIISDRSVEWAQYYCWFKGAGYEHVDKDPNVHYTKNYMPDL